MDWINPLYSNFVRSILELISVLEQQIQTQAYILVSVQFSHLMMTSPIWPAPLDSNWLLPRRPFVPQELQVTPPHLLKMANEVFLLQTEVRRKVSATKQWSRSALCVYCFSFVHLPRWDWNIGSFMSRVLIPCHWLHRHKCTAIMFV